MSIRKGHYRYRLRKGIQRVILNPLAIASAYWFTDANGDPLPYCTYAGNKTLLLVKSCFDLRLVSGIAYDDQILRLPDDGHYDAIGGGGWTHAALVSPTALPTIKDSILLSSTRNATFVRDWDFNGLSNGAFLDLQAFVDFVTQTSISWHPSLAGLLKADVHPDGHLDTDLDYGLVMAHVFG